MDSYLHQYRTKIMNFCKTMNVPIPEIKIADVSTLVKKIYLAIHAEQFSNPICFIYNWRCFKITKNGIPEDTVCRNLRGED